MPTSPTKILLVEDNRADAVLLQDTLAGSGSGAFVWSWDDRLEKALVRLKHETFDAILLDLTLPDSHGLVTLQRVQAVARTIPTVILTGMEDEEAAIRAIRQGAQDYLVKGSADGRAIVKAIRYAIDRKKADDALRRSEAAYMSAKISVDTVNALSVGVILADMRGAVLSINPAFEKTTGYKNNEMPGRRTEDLMREMVDPAELPGVMEALTDAQDGRPVDFLPLLITAKNGSRVPIVARVSHIRDAAGLASAIVFAIQDVTQQREAEERDRAITSLLTLFAKTSSQKDYLDAAVKLLRNATQCNCVGIRVVTPDDHIPYESSVGFSQEFLGKESMLSLRGDVCACLRVAAAHPESQDMPLMTKAGSFSCNNSAEYIGSLAENEQKRFRGHCLKEGFLSISITPVRRHDRVLGVIHLADPKPAMISPNTMIFMETVAPIIGEALIRFQAEQAIEAYLAELRSLSFRLSLAEERARRELAVALHDSVGQTLALSKIKLGGLKQHLIEPEARKALMEVRELFDTAVRQTRTLSFELSPPILYELGLNAALEWLGEEFQRRHGFQFHFESDGDKEAIPESVSVLMFQAARELLVNVGKHADARHVRVTSCRNDGSLVVVVNDDGKGFDAEAAPGDAIAKTSLGLFSIRERMRHIGGAFVIESTRGRGTTATLRAPCGTGVDDGAEAAPGDGCSILTLKEETT